MSKNKIFKEVLSWIFPVLGAFILVMFINTKVFAVVQVQQSSMDDTLKDGQKLVIDKVSYNFTEPKRGDILIFLDGQVKRNYLEELRIYFKDLTKAQDSSKRLVKRIIAVPGDEVDIKEGHVYLNGEKLEESYAKGETLIKEFKLPVVVPQGKVFVLGDNREGSRDSRDYGFVELKSIEGRAKVRVWPMDKISLLK